MSEETSLYLRHPLSALTTEDVEVRLSAYNQTEESQHIRLDGRRLALQRVKRGAVLATQDLSSLLDNDTDRIELKPNRQTDWEVKVPVGQPGIYRFLAALGDLANSVNRR